MMFSYKNYSATGFGKLKKKLKEDIIQGVRKVFRSISPRSRGKSVAFI